MVKTNEKERLFEIFKRVVPDFDKKILNERHEYNDSIDGFEELQSIEEEIGGGIQQQAQPNPQVQQPKQPGDVKTLGKAMGNATAVQKAGGYINTPLEFPEAFRVWFSSLGVAQNHAMTKGTILRNIGQVLDTMGYK